MDIKPVTIADITAQAIINRERDEEQAKRIWACVENDLPACVEEANRLLLERAEVLKDLGSITLPAFSTTDLSEDRPTCEHWMAQRLQTIFIRGGFEVSILTDNRLRISIRR